MPRKITKEQFANKTTLDGNRLEKSFSDLQEKINNIPLEDIRNKYIPYQIVGGFTPSKAQFLTRPTVSAPVLTSPDDPFGGASSEKTGMDCWLPASHTFDNTVYAEITTTPATIPDNKKENPVSVKGSSLLTNYYETDNKVRNFVMTNAYSTVAPVIIDEVSVWVGLNAHFAKRLTSVRTVAEVVPPNWYNDANENFKSVADLQFYISVDHEDLTESVQLRTNELMKSDFHAWSGNWNQHPFQSYSTERLPDDLGLPTLYTPPTDIPQITCYFTDACLFFTFKDLNISVPEYGRWRFHILIPDYQLSKYIDGTDWGTRPDLFELSFSITGKEELS